MLLRLFLVSVFTVELSPCGKKIPNLFQVAIPVAALLLQLVLIRILCAETGNESGESFPVTRIFNPFFVVDILHEFIFKGEKIIIVEVFECVLAREFFIGVSTYIKGFCTSSRLTDGTALAGESLARPLKVSRYSTASGNVLSQNCCTRVMASPPVFCE